MWLVEWCKRNPQGVVTDRMSCVIAHQPKGEPTYRDHVKTLCKHVVTLPVGFSQGSPTCPDCVESLSRKETRAGLARQRGRKNSG